MKHHVKLVKGNDHKIVESDTKKKKQHTTLTLSLTREQLDKMKSTSGLKGDVSVDQIVKTFIKFQLLYGL